MNSHPSFVAVDWGTSSFRLWVLSSEGAIMGESRGADGMLHAAKVGFETVLEKHLRAANAPDGLPVLICGMAGARGGWVEAGYVDTPAKLSAVADHATSAPNAGRDIRILPGFCQRGGTRPDVMRGEETQLLGAAQSLTGDTHVCMPGTHSKWVSMSDDRVEGFSTFMTGELFDAISKHTILAVDDGTKPDGPESEAFGSAVTQAFETPGRLTSQLFAARSGQILNGMSPEASLAHISGSLIGAEIGGATGSTKPSEPVRLVASGRLRELYEAALKILQIDFKTVDADEAVRNGLIFAASHIWQERN